MTFQKFASLVLAASAPMAALAQTAPAMAPTRNAAAGAADIQALRQEMRAMQAEYEARLQALEKRLQQAQSSPASTTAATTGAAVSPAPVTAQAAPAALPAQLPQTAQANGFNPALSLILSGGYSRTKQDPANYGITGIQLPQGGEFGPGTRGFSLAESELGISANADPWLSGQANFSLHPDDTVSVEEAFLRTTALGNGLSLKAGRMFSGIGYLNAQHAHTWDFVDNPLAYQAFLGTQLADDGVQLKWLAPIDQYLELGLEVGRGRGYPGSDTARNGAGMTALTLHTGGDVGVSNSWRAGASVLKAKANNQAMDVLDSSGTLVTNAFTGTTRLWVLDGVWKWAPGGNATRTNFKLQGEYLRSTRDGSLTYDTQGVNNTDSYRAVQSGWYLQGIYQFMPRWRVGLRTERLNAGSPSYGSNALALAGTGYTPTKHSLMLDYSPSEFSRVRLQLAQDKSRQGAPDTQFFINYQLSLGAHGAHSY